MGKFGRKSFYITLEDKAVCGSTVNRYLYLDKNLKV